jgi:3-methyl-2-oxobutanoate hydroxymethyltransferase
MEGAGAFGLLIECIPDKLAQVITESIAIPTIGIGAGVHCDGQVLVINDLLGMFDKFTPKFVKKYANLSPIIKESVQQYNNEVKAGTYPDSEHSFSSDADYRALLTE